jgi:RNA recognition motif-containing protein
MYPIQFQASGMSRNYKGNPFLRANQSANIPDEENCSLWITNLPPDCTERSLLANVRHCGKVYATVINPPDLANGHCTSAAKLVFMYVDGAKALIKQAQQGIFTIDTYVPKVVSNRIKTAAQTPGPESRSIHIEGPKVIVNFNHFDKWFSERFKYEIDEITVISDAENSGGFRRLEWRFGSYRCQASSAMTFIEKERRRHLNNFADGDEALWKHVNVYYGVDPCA